ncbi:MAG TPA: hypothetical protein VJ765_02110 [Chitinophagaceae bacterium]|nr:hypothetical protein [Chitinophagaceae bacterium]
MPRIKRILCSGICFLYFTALSAQVAPPKNKTPANVLAYQQYQQKQWNYNQLPKNSIQYTSDRRYIPFPDKKVSTSVLHLYPIAIPEVKKSFSVASSAAYSSSKSYLQSSRFMKYEWQKQNQWRTPRTGVIIYYHQ